MEEAGQHSKVNSAWLLLSLGEDLQSADNSSEKLRAARCSLDDSFKS